jgi:hypothetical protein
VVQSESDWQVMEGDRASHVATPPEIWHCSPTPQTLPAQVDGPVVPVEPWVEVVLLVPVVPVDDRPLLVELPFEPLAPEEPRLPKTPVDPAWGRHVFAALQTYPLAQSPLESHGCPDGLKLTVHAPQARSATARSPKPDR